MSTTTQQTGKPTILSPVRLFEKLSTINQDQQGNTPTPSMGMLCLLNGMRAIGKNNETAGKNLTRALAEAEKSKDQEEMAVALLGLGYFYTTTNEFDKSIQLYKGSFEIWKKIHGENNLKLADLILDIAKIYQILNNESDFKKTIDTYQELYKKNNQPVPKIV
ncbi:hypothetical protein DICPUDRAFT_78128 [Dictyostelium purpureum]|uniref:Tetratricopeptide repeat protein n=1 Tax=Dictyostelium purpureum TaxID=5786 RepID=F0ZIM5_DICPU|nr:uncharacterized protein DICPUDRAFT_78128 [Dictyostelium purpureum]EGC36192.1 hypothetical protein DICPUDRAFT_78128 [Dictyostelium purpureum]|eukprot:XP_003287259.1 hypothetical protein DICPUDRAFT_78128 [Dictyostelium purpureum]